MSAHPHSRPSPDPAAPTLSDLVGRISRGEECALEALYDATSASAYGLALRILADVAAAEDVLQEVYYDAWNRACDFDPKRGTAWAWLLTMTRSRAIDRRRAMQVRPTVSETALASTMDPNPAPDTNADLADRSVRVRQALDGLGPDQREAIELAFFEGLSHSRIAQRLQQPLGTIKTRIRLGMRRLAALLIAPEELR